MRSDEIKEHFDIGCPAMHYRYVANRPGTSNAVVDICIALLRVRGFPASCTTPPLMSISGLIESRTPPSPGPLRYGHPSLGSPAC